ncbi:MAG: hypothetical protein KC462_06240, partial [Cyanobacteria bacterium HKST-UBA05]|nr:hypothetical protein [Cyanobacteria bacterium HKST-UBA05]
MDKPPQAKSWKDSQTAVNQIIYPRYTNELKLARAGPVLKLVDVAASFSAHKHAGRGTVTACLDYMNFVDSARVWDIVTAHCRLTQTWHTSMEIEVTVDTQNVRSMDKRMLAKGYLVFVAMDDDMRPTTVPPLALETAEDKLLATDAEVRKQSRKQEELLASQRDATRILPTCAPAIISRVMTDNDSNIHQKVFGGAILELIHEAGVAAAQAHVNGPVITVRQDRMSFKASAAIGDTVTALANLTRTWTTSMEVQVDVVATSPGSPEERVIASSFLVLVAQDEQARPRKIPPFVPVTERQQQRYKDADVRRQTR